MFQTPILLLVFNRLDTTQRVWQALRALRPAKLYVVADGPRAHKPDEANQCQAVRNYIQENMDWDGKLCTLFRPSNLGCKLSVSMGIDWFFEQEEQGIILEDDCLPHPTFFPFCEQLLRHYAQDERIMHIGGKNFQHGQHRGAAGDSYYFSRLSHIWGWATWRRAWQHYNRNMQGLEAYLQTHKAKDLGWQWFYYHKYRQNFNKVKDGRLDTWDYQWNFSVWQQNAYCIVPNVNLVTNIGFDNQATHTANRQTLEDGKQAPMLFPMQHPKEFQYHPPADNYTLGVIYGRNYWERTKRFIQNKLSK
jgi:hypothetical protein